MVIVPSGVVVVTSVPDGRVSETTTRFSTFGGAAATTATLALADALGCGAVCTTVTSLDSPPHAATATVRTKKGARRMARSILAPVVD